MRRLFLSKLAFLRLVVLGAAILYLYMRPVPAISPQSQITVPPKTQAVTLPWPAAGQAALGAAGYGVLAIHNTTAPVSIASVAKVITALALLQQKPLALGAQGPIIALDNTDLDYFNYYYLNNGSVSKVEPGEKITEYQALQALMLPSSNNMADSLVRWAFGSPAAYATYANRMVKNMGLANTVVGSASGFSDDTTSTAEELVKLGLRAMSNPMLAQIVGQTSANIPVAGDVNNVNYLLGTDGVAGIKTGNTDKAGGCYLFAAKRQIQGHSVMVVGAVLGAPDLIGAITGSVPLITAADSGFTPMTIIHKNQVVGTYRTPWSQTAQAVASKDINILAWKGLDIKEVNKLNPLNTPAKAGTEAGSVTAQNGGFSLKSNSILNNDLSAPPWTWRLFR